ncbi:22848_t:CDS:2 [Entrophospora sp. SA101]|nr:11117_t:CDS:2 [Entrophospora sp. SA101]CAJ0749049.1 22848_t:CDS:2 [Entrophospora sp. SA101]CAJ0890074.1 10193_t:CDS:2 [Entrophospora sp. SA101]CAJ0924498.1 16470_t:CDS:2 [Entrophospora sp. SA101]
MFTEQLNQIKVDFSGPVPLPTERKRFSLPISPHKHKSSQEQFVRELHHRTIHIANPSSQVLENLNKLKVPNTVEQAKQLKEKGERLENANRKLVNNIEKIKLQEEKLRQEEKRINNFANQLLRKEELFTQQLVTSSQREKKIHEEIEKNKRIKQQIIENLEGIILMSSEEAKTILFSLVKEEIEKDLNRYKEKKIKQAEEKIQAESTKIICSALENYSSELVFSNTVNTLSVKNPSVISKIIGKEGRNINVFRRITGVEVIIDEEKEENVTIQISSFNSLRREIASQTLRSLLQEERISPAQIEKTFHKVTTEINSLIRQTGEAVLKELELSGVHSELVKHLGKLKYRTSYGQNVLQHSLEVAKLAGNMAAELGLDIHLARRVGLLHDIGKAVEDNGEYSHVASGVILAKKYRESEIVINAIASHHHNIPADNFYSSILLAADKLSAARPGVRGYQLESYVERMNNLEKITNEFPGIKKSYAFQAGREI